MIIQRFTSKTKTIGITTRIAQVVMLLLFFISCSNDKKDIVVVEFDPETTYTLRTSDVVQLISDSGVTQCRITAKEWYAYDKAAEPYWYFPEGFYFEKFDSLFNTEASIKADTVYNYHKKELWKLVGNVKIENTEGKKFETSLLYWDQKGERIYSDQFIRIEEEDKVITGYGFESNQEMTDYKIFNSAGQFPMRESQPDSTQTNTTEN